MTGKKDNYSILERGNKKIAPIFLSNNLSATLIIPIEMARRKGLDKPSHVIIEENDHGILIKKLEI